MNINFGLNRSFIESSLKALLTAVFSASWQDVISNSRESNKF